MMMNFYLSLINIRNEIQIGVCVLVYLMCVCVYVCCVTIVRREFWYFFFSLLSQIYLKNRNVEGYQT